MNTRSAKNKGKRLQNKVADLIRETFKYVLEEDDVKSTTMGESGIDVRLSPLAKKIFPYATECKNTERLDLWGSIKQSEENAGGLTPILVFKRNRSDIYVCLKFTEFLRIISRREK